VLAFMVCLFCIAEPVLAADRPSLAQKATGQSKEAALKDEDNLGRNVSQRASSAPGFELVSYGTAAWRENNLVKPQLRSAFGTSDTETRLLIGGRNHAASLRPYFKVSPAWSSSDIPPENTLTFGVGAEIRPLTRIYFGRDLEWLTRTRIYTEYLDQTFFRTPAPSIFPRQDWAIGFDIWREYGFVDPNRLHLDEHGHPLNERDHAWGELFVGAAFHTTNFSRRGYNAILAGFDIKVGLRYGSRDLPFMPYVYADLNAVPRYGEDYFNNRLIGGIGIRTEHRFGRDSKIEIFAEWRGIISYVEATPLYNNVPVSDWRAGLTYQFSRY